MSYCTPEFSEVLVLPEYVVLSTPEYFVVQSTLHSRVLVLWSTRTSTTCTLKNNYICTFVVEITYFSFSGSNIMNWTHNFLFKIYSEAGTFVLALFSSLIFQLALVAQWLVSRTFTATRPGTKSCPGSWDEGRNFAYKTQAAVWPTGPQRFAVK